MAIPMKLPAGRQYMIYYPAGTTGGRRNEEIARELIDALHGRCSIAIPKVVRHPRMGWRIFDREVGSGAKWVEIGMPGSELECLTSVLTG